MAFKTRFQNAHRALQAGEAERALTEARALLRDYPDSRDALALIALIEHHLGNHQLALTGVEYLLADDGENAELLNNRIALLMKLGRFKAAVDACLDSLKSRPKDRATRLNLGHCYLSENQFLEAINCYEALVPDYPDDLEVLGLGTRAYYLVGDPARALQVAEKSLQLNPRSKKIRTDLAILHSELGNAVEAMKLYQDLLADSPGSEEPELLRGLGVNQIYLGETAAAAASLRRAISLSPRFFEAWRVLSTIAPLSAAEVVQLTTLYQDTALSPQDQALAGYALARALEAEPRKALEHYQSANRALRQARAPCESEFESYQREYHLNRRITDGLQSRVDQCRPLPLTPVFVVGLPRSGTTLAERILNAHSKVGAAGEVNYLSIALDQWMKRLGLTLSDARNLIEKGDSSLQALREDYCHMLAGHSKAALVTDKWLYNFLKVGLIARLFPESPIVYCRKPALENAFSIFTTYFVQRHNYSTDFAEIAQVIALEREAMSHWQQDLPGRIYQLDKQALVDQFETQVRHLLNACGLEFEPACLSFFETGGVVQTASTIQVREPVSDSSRRRFEAFQPYLGTIESLFTNLD